MIDWQRAVTTRYGIAPTAEAIRAACAGWGWRFQVDVVPQHGAVVCAITVPLADGDVEQLGVGATPDEAACRALIQLPHDPPGPNGGSQS